MTGSPAPWSRVYLLLSGGWLLVVGLVGFALDASFPVTSSDVRNGDYIFGLFETNGWHNLAAVGLGLPSLLVVGRWPRWQVETALAAGTSGLLVFTAFALWDSSTFLVAANGADQALHAAQALGLVAGAVDIRRRQPPSTTAGRTHRPRHDQEDPAP